MSLTSHKYSYVSDEEEFFTKNSSIFELLVGSAIERVYGVWDCIDGIWFDDAPMIVKTSLGTMSVNVKSDSYVAIGWNDIPLNEKPKWFDEAQCDIINELNWTEDLVWKDYHDVCSIYGERIKMVRFHHGNEKWGVGIGLESISGKCLWICDGGDVISARVEVEVNSI